MDVALVLAVIALALSLLSFGWTIGWSIWQHRATTQPRFAVQGSFAVEATVESPAQRVFAMRALNTGSVPATVTLVSAQVEGAPHHVIFNTS